MTALAPVAAVLATLILAGLAVLQVLVASGRPLGHLVWGGQHRVLPGGLRIASAASVVLYAGIAAVLLDRARLLSIHGGGFVDTATWVLVCYFTVGILLNLISRSRTERLVMTPTCAVIAACSLVVALG